MFEIPNVISNQNIDVSGDNVTSNVQLLQESFALLGTVPQTASLAHPVTALRFDPLEELLWSANSGGRVVSFFGASLAKYTAYLSAVNDVQDVLCTDSVVLSLTSNQLKGNRRQGTSLFSHTSENMYNMCCLHRCVDTPQFVLIGGHQNKLIQLDIETRKEKQIVEIKQKDCLSIRSNQKFIFSSDSTGNITLRHKNSVEDLHAIQAHQHSVADFDVHGNNLITCGYSTRRGNVIGDRFLMIYDLRTLRSMQPITLPFAPLFCRFLPSYSPTRIMIVSRAGEFVVMYLNERVAVMPFHIDLNGMPLFSADVSPSRQCIAFGDSAGVIHLFSDRAQPIFVEGAYSTEFPDSVPCHHVMGINDPVPPFSIFPLPFSIDDHYLSDWPENMCAKQYREPDPIPSNILQSMRMVHFVGYARNPRAGTPLRVHNIQPYSDVPTILKRSNEVTEKLLTECMNNKIPKFYRRNAREKTEFNTESDYESFNETEYTSIECLPQCLPAAPTLLALFNIPVIRNIILQHFCSLKTCITCEASFLFRRLILAKSKIPLNIVSFLPLLLATNDGNKWMLNDETEINTNLQIRVFIDQLLAIILQELGEISIGVELINCLQMFSLNSRCSLCSSRSISSSSQLSIRLLLPQNIEEKISFCNLLEKSANTVEQKEEFCRTCNRSTRFSIERRIRSLPQIILVDLCDLSDSQRIFLALQLEAFESKKQLLSSSVRKFNEKKRTDNSSSVVKDGDFEFSQYIMRNIYVKASDDNLQICESNVKNSVHYNLQCIVAGIGSWNTSITHLITLAREASDSNYSNSEDNWIVFNDHVVQRITENEALFMDACWKVPYLLFYVQDGLNIENDILPISKSVLLSNFNESSFSQKAIQDSIKKGQLVAVCCNRIYFKENTNDVNDSDEKKDDGFFLHLTCVNEDGFSLIDDFVQLSDDNCLMQYSFEWSSADGKIFNKPLVDFKTTCVKLLYMMQEEVHFITHGSGANLKIFNLNILPVNDTMCLFRLESHPKISLIFLATFLFEENFDETMNAVDRAILLIRIFKTYKKLKENGEYESAVTRLLEKGNQCNWDVEKLIQ